jgi:hypothetical protein
MISQSCPRCHSSRIRRGYRPTPLWSKIMFRYNLLCDSCNWEFKGFAVPGTVSAKPTKRRKAEEKSIQVIEEEIAVPLKNYQEERRKKRVKIRL